MRRSRVLVVAAGLFLGLSLLWLRVGWLQVVRHAHYRARAERNHDQRVLIHPTRGQLLDRHGRPLARDLPSYSISAAPREMKNARATARELAKVLDLDPRKLERRFAARPRFLWVARRVTPEIGQRIAAWKRRGVYLALETRREYVLGEVAAEIIGRTNVDHVGVEGLELKLDPSLRGRPGWTTLFRDGRGRSHDMDSRLRRRPEDGHNVVLTLDAELQSIVETHLARAVDTLKAVRGFALFVDPRTGEVLASVNVPHLPPGRTRNWVATDQFEPGSTFKIVVAGAALEEGLVRPEQVFEAAADGAAMVAANTVFHDVHKQACYTFRDAVRWSSNIVMGRLGLKVGNERLYRYVTQFGFGSLTGLGFPGEAAGKLRSPERWSSRSCPTIAIGHEISVTAVQLAMAYAAVANGGLLMQPMLVREIRDPDGEAVRRFSPTAAHRVLSDGTTRLLRDMLTAVVDSGTARAAGVEGLRVAGKTGTAQKYDAAVRTYGQGMYLSSFAGFVPADDPCLLGVVVIDEPRGRQYYGGEVAAPVFGRIIEDVRRLPHGPLGSGIARVAERPPAPAPVVVPDLSLLLRGGAESRLAELGLRVHFGGSGPRVVAQEPAAGQAVERGSSVTAWLSAPGDSAARLPDLVGLPVREAVRRLTRLGVRVRIEGIGVVTRQSPAPNSVLPLGGECRLWCEPILTAVTSNERSVMGSAVSW
jgi:cell division protein FtsI/penicillin-binding protein 2